MDLAADLQATSPNSRPEADSQGRLGGVRDLGEQGRAVLPEGLEVTGFIIGGLGLPAAIENAHPLKG